jgi:sugar transferase EpsL
MNAFYRKYGKRAFDLALTLPTLLILSPVMAFVALVVWLRFDKPVIFRQQRPGLHGRPFTILKFRTMTDQRDAQGNLLPDGERLPRCGRLLRALSLDELPQLWNVLRGDVSLVGPRPLLLKYLECYTPEQMRRHEVRPGITGWCQVNGRNRLSWNEKFALDVWYVDHVSFALDLWIILKTIPTLLLREGISAPGVATMPEFTGASNARSLPSE